MSMPSGSLRRRGHVSSRAARRLALAALVFGALALEACGGSASNLFRRGGSQTTLVVESRNWTDHTIYVSRAGSRSRLGTVTSNQTRSFRIPASIATPGATIRFQADPVGSARVYASREVTIGDGETWVWTLMPQIEQSTLFQR